MPEELKEPVFQGLNTAPAEEYEATRAGTHKRLEQYLVKDPEIEGLLAEIDFEEINRLTTEDFRKSGGALLTEERAHAHTIFPKDIIYVSAEGAEHIGMPSGTIMGYLPTARVIIMNHKLVQGLKESFPNVPFPLLFLKVLMHEENHVASSLTASEYVGEISVIQAGMARHAYRPDGTLQERYDFWNEAVNERRALELTRKYLESNKLSGVQRKHLELLNPEQSRVSTAEYLLGMKIVEEVMKKIVKATKLPKETVWLSLVHASMQGLNLDSPDARRAIDFDEILGREFLKELMLIENAPDGILSFIKKYKLGHIQEYVAIVNERFSNKKPPSLSDMLGQLPPSASGGLPGLPGSASSPPPLPGLPQKPKK